VIEQVAYTYDDNGNLAQKSESTNPSNVTSYTWDSRNRLTSITQPGLVATFDYDARHRRIARAVNGQTTRYLYDDLQALGEIVNGERIGLLSGLSLDEAIARYKARGEPVEEVLSEDWGWCVMLTRKPFALWVGCSNRAGQTDEWGAFVVAELSILVRLFRRVDTKAAVDRVLKFLEEVMHEIPDPKKIWVEPAGT
jgi:YD repeat-containing protein